MICKDAPLNGREVRQAAGLGVRKASRERRQHVLLLGQQVDGGAMLPRLLRQAPEARQPRQRHVHLRTHCPAFNPHNQTYPAVALAALPFPMPVSLCALRHAPCMVSNARITTQGDPKQLSLEKSFVDNSTMAILLRNDAV